MLASERILFFGHSLCMSDKEYFTSLFCASQNNHCKQIDFIIHDENGKDLILDNIEQLSKLNIAKVRENIRINFYFTKEQYKGETKKAIDDFMDDSDNKYSFFGHADVSPWPAAQRPFVYLMKTYVAYVFRAKRLTQTLYLLFLCPFVLMFSALAATQTKKHHIPLTSSLSAPSAPIVMLAPHAVQCSLAAASARHLQLHQFTS